MFGLKNQYSVILTFLLLFLLPLTGFAGEKEIICDQSSDAFLYALILFGLLTGRHPFSFDRDCEEDDREELWERMCDGKSLYFWENPVMIRTLKEVFENTAPDADTLFRRTFDYCGYETYGEDRPSVVEWLKCLKGTAM